MAVVVIQGGENSEGRGGLVVILLLLLVAAGVTWYAWTKKIGPFADTTLSETTPSADFNLSAFGPSPAPAPSAPTPIVLGVGQDNMLYTKTFPTDGWTMVPSSGPMAAKGILQRADGTLLCADSNFKVHKKNSLSPADAWGPVLSPGGDQILQMVEVSSNVFFSGNDQKIYTFGTDPTTAATSGIAPDNNGCCILGLFKLSDGTFGGMGTDNTLYGRPSLTSGTWSQITPATPKFLSVADLGGGSFMGIGTDNMTYTAAALAGPWTKTTDTQSMILVTPYKVPTPSTTSTYVPEPFTAPDSLWSLE